MMLLAKDLLHYAEPAPRTLRVLWLSDNDLAYIMDVEDRQAVPVAIRRTELLGDINEGRARLLPVDPYLVVADDKVLSVARMKRRNGAWVLIEKLVKLEPDIYVPAKRSALVEAIVANKLSTRVTIYAHLRRFWQRGMTKNALLSDHDKSGGAGQVRESTDGIKRGRPRIYGDQPGINVTDEIRRIFHVSVDRWLATSEKFSKQASFDKMIEDFFCEKSVDPETNLITNLPIGTMATSGNPTFGQYDYWLGQGIHPLVLKRARMSARRYDKDLRGLIGTSAAETWGPGSRFQIDATIADVFLVSRFDRNKIIGRPVLYIVIDVFSRMIVGIYIGLEGPSWVGAMMALANTNDDKVEFCRQRGITIGAADWPCHYLPATLLGDKGEIESAKIDALSNNFNVIIETAQAYRADWKGVVERRFRLLPAAYKPYVPGYIDVDYRARGGKDYRLDARLDIDDFTQIIIHCALYFNNDHEITRYDKDRKVAADGVPAIPTELWQWGVEHTSGRLRSFPEDQVRFALMPVDMATVTTFGLLFQHSYYTCAKALEERWFDRARQQKTWKVRVSYDPRAKDRIYLHDASHPKGFHVCTLTERSRAHNALSSWEVSQQLEAGKHDTANRKQGQQLAKADLISNIERIVEKAGANVGTGKPRSAAAQTNDIRINRAAEKQANRANEAFALGGEQSPARESATILPFPVVGTGNQGYDEPDITELMNAWEEPDDQP